MNSSLRPNPSSTRSRGNGRRGRGRKKRLLQLQRTHLRRLKETRPLLALEENNSSNPWMLTLNLRLEAKDRPSFKLQIDYNCYYSVHEGKESARLSETTRGIKSGKRE